MEYTKIVAINVVKQDSFKTMLDFRLPPASRSELRSSGMLRSEKWQILTDVSVQPIGPIFKGRLCLTLEYGAESLYQKVGKELPLLVA